MDAKLIQEMLEKAIMSAAKPVEKNDNEMLSTIAKAVQAIGAKVDALEKTTVKNEPETLDTVVGKLAKAVEAINAKVEAIANPVKPEDQPVDLTKMSKKQFTDFITEIVKPKAPEAPKGQGKETQKSILDGANDNDEVDVDISAIESNDIAGNELSETQRLARKNLDDFIGAKIGGISDKYVGSRGDDNAETETEE